MNMIRCHAKFPRVARNALWRLHLGHKLSEEERGTLREQRLGHLLDQPELSGVRGGDFAYQLPTDRRSLHSQAGTTGGFLIHTGDVLATFLEAHDSINPWRTLARMQTIRAGNESRQALAVDAGQEGFEYVENTTVPEAGNPVFSQFVFRFRTWHSGFVRVPHGLTEDAPQMLDVLPRLLARRCGRIERRKWTERTIPTLPKVQADGAANVTAADIARALDAVHENCQDSPNYAIMCHPTLARRFHNMADSAGHMIWPGGHPFDVRRVLRNPSMTPFSSLASGSVSLIAGDFGAVSVVDHDTVNFRVLTERPGAAERDQLDFQAVIRSDMAVIDDGGTTHTLVALQH